MLANFSIVYIFVVHELMASMHLSVNIAVLVIIIGIKAGNVLQDFL